MIRGCRIALLLDDFRHQEEMIFGRRRVLDHLVRDPAVIARLNEKLLTAFRRRAENLRQFQQLLIITITPTHRLQALGRASYMTMRSSDGTTNT